MLNIQNNILLEVKYIHINTNILKNGTLIYKPLLNKITYDKIYIEGGHI